MKRWLALALVVLIVLLSRLGWGEDLIERVRRLTLDGSPDLALAMIEDHESRGGAMSDGLRWEHALLVTDGDRFDRLAAELIGGRSGDDPYAQSVVVARAKEQFARGQYLSALENLRALPAAARESHPEISLFIAMASQAVGEQAKAAAALDAMGPTHPQYAMAQMLLAELGIRARESESALSHAKNALDANPKWVGAQALYAQHEAYRMLDDTGKADGARSELLKKFPRSVEATWVRSAGAPPPSRGNAALGSPVDEIEQPLRRSDFALQLGAFHDRSLALRHAHRVGDTVEALRIERDLESSPPWYRVVAGNYSTRAQADEARRALAEQGVEGVVLSPGQGGP